MHLRAAGAQSFYCPTPQVKSDDSSTIRIDTIYMDWPRNNPELAPRDRGTFRHVRGTSKVLRMLDNGRPETWELKSNTEWMDWLSKDHLEPIRDPDNEGGTVVLLAGRYASDFDDDGCHNPAQLSYLPFSSSTQDCAFERFHVHGSIARTINRGQAVFSRTNLRMGTDPEPAIVYHCRSSNSWADDMALSVTYFPRTRSTYGVFYGCNPTVMDEMHGRISKSTAAALYHPMLLVGVFAELERKRQLESVRRQLELLVTRVSALGRHDADWGAGGGHEALISDAIDPWLNVNYLKNGLEDWAEQMDKMVAHVHELGSEDSSQSLDPELRQRIEQEGLRIEDRLQEIICDYRQKIRECTMISDGMTLATELAHTRANIDIALSTKRDSGQMKSIALLTMIFLPATFVATLFSMTFFQWLPEDSDQIVSPFVWIYFLVTISLTLITVGLWHFLTNKREPAPVEKSPV